MPIFCCTNDSSSLRAFRPHYLDNPDGGTALAMRAFDHFLTTGSTSKSETNKFLTAGHIYEVVINGETGSERVECRYFAVREDTGHFEQVRRPIQVLERNLLKVATYQIFDCEKHKRQWEVIIYCLPDQD